MSFLGDELSTVRRIVGYTRWVAVIPATSLAFGGGYAEVGGVDGLVAGGRGMSHWDTMHRLGSVGG